MSSFKPKMKVAINKPTDDERDHRNQLVASSIGTVHRCWAANGGGKLAVMLLDLNDNQARDIAEHIIGHDAVAYYRRTCKDIPVIAKAVPRDALAEICDAVSPSSTTARVLRGKYLPGHIDTVVIAAGGTGLARLPINVKTSAPCREKGNDAPANNNARPEGVGTYEYEADSNTAPYFRIQAFTVAGATLVCKDLKTVGEAVALMQHDIDFLLMCSVMPAGHPDEGRLHEALKRALADGGQIDTSIGLGSPADGVCIFVGK